MILLLLRLVSTAVSLTGTELLAPRRSGAKQERRRCVIRGGSRTQVSTIVGRGTADLAYSRTDGDGTPSPRRFSDRLLSVVSGWDMSARAVSGRVMFDALAKRSMRLVLKELAVAVKPTEQVIQAGNDQDPHHGAQQHPTDRGATDRAVTDGPWAGGPDQRNQTGDEGEGGHQNRPEAQFSAFDGCLA